MAIRYDKKLNNEIDKTIRNFNAKITRLEKQGFSPNLLPNKITKKALKEDYDYRKGLVRKLNEMKSFSKRGAEETLSIDGDEITKYEFEIIKKNIANAKRILTRNIKNYENKKVKIAGKNQPSTFSQIGDQAYLTDIAKREALNKNIKKLTKEDLKRIEKLAKKTIEKNYYMNSIFKSNYLEMLTALGYQAGYDKEKMEKIEEKIMKLKPAEFLKLFNEDKAIKSILDYYPIITGQIKGMNIEDIKTDVTGLYDVLYDNIDNIVKEYA